MSQSFDCFKRVLVYGQNNFGIKIRFKNQSKLMKALSLFLFLNKNFMTQYTTTLGKTIYFPSEKWLEENRERASKVLCHELVHVADEDRIGSFVFRMTYLFPQWMSLFALCALFVGPWALAFLLFLAPLPAPFRAFWELRAYTVSDAVLYSQRQQFIDTKWLIKQFTSEKYYFMWPFQSSASKEIKENRKMIKAGILSEKIPSSSKILAAFQGKLKK